MQAGCLRSSRMKIDVLTIFPEFFREVFDFGIIRRAKLAGIVEINVHDIREFTTDKHRMVDDRPFGGGDGMVLKPEPILAFQAGCRKRVCGRCGTDIDNLRTVRRYRRTGERDTRDR